MDTTKNSHKDPSSAASEEKLLLNELMLILRHNEYISSSCDDMPIYVHEKPQAYNICKIDADAKRETASKMLEAKYMTKIATVKGGESCVC